MFELGGALAWGRGMLAINAQDESRHDGLKKALPRSGDGPSFSARRGVVLRSVLTRWLMRLEGCSPSPNALYLAEGLPVNGYSLSQLCLARLVFEVNAGRPSLGVAYTIGFAVIV